MIFSSRNYPFNGAVTTLVFPQLVVRISTAKEGVFSKQSTMISLIPNVMAGPSQNSVIAKILWADALRSADRQRAHHDFVARLDNVVETGWQEILSLNNDVPEFDSLGPILDDALSLAQSRGMVKEFINLLRY